MLCRYLSSLLIIAVAGVAQTASTNPWFIAAGAQISSDRVQQPDASTKRYPVSGSVINSLTGAPISRAVVRLMGQEPAQVFTGDDGHFEFKDVPEGGVFLAAQRPGFQNSAPLYRQRITVGSSTPSVQLKLMPKSSLHGRVMSTDGDPVEGASVQIFRRQVIGGIREWTPVNAASSDESGSYLLEDVVPGAYLVYMQAHTVFTADLPVVVDGRHFPDLYRAQYYPNAPDRSSAQPVQIQPGADAQVDFTATAVPSYMASGSVSNGRGFSASCDNAEGEAVSRTLRVDRDGKFTLMQLPSGACTLRVRTGLHEGNAVYGELPINIASSDVAGLQLTLDPLPDIPVIISGGSDGNENGINLQLRPRLMNQNGGFPGTTRKGDALVFSSVTPGVYRLSAQVSGGRCIGSVIAGDVDLLQSDLTVTPGGSSAPIQVVLRNDCGSITGTAEETNSSTDPVSVVAVPQHAPSLAKMLTSRGGGSVQIADLTPGDYTIYAAADLSEFPYAEPEALKGVEGQKVTVGPGAKVNIQLKVQPAGSGAGAGGLP